MSALLLLAASLSLPASAQSGVPNRQVPASVLSELYLLQSRFELALAGDCDDNRCFSKGCTYVAHAVVDQPRGGSLPGLGLDPGPGSIVPQDFLTRAQCGFAHEQSEDSGDIQALTRRLQSKLSQGWLVVAVDHQLLQPLPPYLRQPPAEPLPEASTEPPPVPEPEPVPEVWSPTRELWASLLPHFYWMIAVVLLTLAATALIWAWRRVGRASPEEQALLAQLAREDSDESNDDDGTIVSMVPDTEEDYVIEQSARWSARLTSQTPDPELEALIRTLLRAGELQLLAKAVLRFPEAFPARFPEGGEIAAAKLTLADYLETVDESTLPTDADFFAALGRHSLSATLSTQSDARVVRSLREDFGTTGLVALIGQLPARVGSLLFALAPLGRQHEMARLLSSQQTMALSSELLRSDRMAPGETAYLFSVLQSARDGTPLPAPPPAEMPDRGASFDAAGALSVLLERLAPSERAALFGAALQRQRGSLPQWHRDIFFADMLSALSDEARVDLVLGVDVDALAAWLSLLERETRRRMLGGLPASLRASVGGAPAVSHERKLALAQRGRAGLARGFQQQLLRSGTAFEQVVYPSGEGAS